MGRLSRFVLWGGVALLMLSFPICLGSIVSGNDLGAQLATVGVIAIFVGVFFGVIANMFSKD